MHRLLIEICQEVKEFFAEHLDPDKINAFGKRYDRIVDKGPADNPAVEKPPGGRGKAKQPTSANLPVRLKKHKADILRFMHDFRVSFDNNQAERDIRRPLQIYP